MLQTKQKTTYTNWKSPDANFDWDEYAADCPSSLREGNLKIKTQPGTKIYSRAKYAQDLYNLILGVAPSAIMLDIKLGEHRTGTIYSISEKWAMMDIGYRELVYIDLDKESPSIRKSIQPGLEFMVKIVSDKNERGFISGSITEGSRQAIITELIESINGNSAYTGLVSQMIPGGGYIVNVNGIDCFMPGSLAGANKLANFESIIGTEMYVVPVSFSHEKGTVVVSHRKYLQAIIPSEIEKIKNNSQDAEYQGTVTGTAKFGVFVEFNGCLTGMIHINDLNPEWHAKQTSSQINPGDIITFKVKEIISNTKITLTQNEIVEEVNPWTNISEKYKVPAEVLGTVKAIKDYGIFVTIVDGIVGLLHVSELDGIDLTNIKKGDPINVTITRIDESTRKVFLKLL